MHSVKQDDVSQVRQTATSTNSADQPEPEQHPAGDRQPLHLVWLIDGDEGYGVANAVSGLAGQIAQHGHHVSVIALNDGSLAQRLQAEGRDVRMLNLGRVPAVAGGFIQRAGRYLRTVRFQRAAVGGVVEALQSLDDPVDAVHVRVPNLIALAGAAAAQVGARAIWQMPNYISDRYPLGLNRRIYQRTCRRHRIIVLANSRYTASTLGPLPYDGGPHVLYLGSDASRFNPDAPSPISRADMHIPENAIVFGIFARLHPSKGQVEFLHALADVQQRRRDTPLHLLLLGGPTDSAYAERLRALAEQHGLQQQVHLPGRVSDPEHYYSVVDVAVNSRVDPEPFGQSVTEAMMMATPILVHASGGPAETVIDGTTGWHVRPATVAAFTEALQRVLDDQPRWEQMGIAARKHAMQYFTLQAHAAKYLEIIEPQLRQVARDQ